MSHSATTSTTTAAPATDSLAAWHAALVELEAAVGITPVSARDAVANGGARADTTASVVDDDARSTGDDASDWRDAPARTVPPVSWSPPRDLGPLPATLAERVSRLIDAQRDAIVRVDDARRAVLGHLGAVGRVADSREPTRSVYLDVTG